MALIIIRGLPGSGKTTIAKLIASSIGAEHWETDMFWMKTGEYEFNPKAIGIAHKWCRDKVAKAIEKGHDVVVSNVFSLAHHIDPFVQMVTRDRQPPTIIRVCGDFENTHNVPPEMMEKFRNEWQDVAGEVCIFL